MPARDTQKPEADVFGMGMISGRKRESNVPSMRLIRRNSTIKQIILMLIHPGTTTKHFFGFTDRDRFVLFTGNSILRLFAFGT